MERISRNEFGQWAAQHGMKWGVLQTHDVPYYSEVRNVPWFWPREHGEISPCEIAHFFADCIAASTLNTPCGFYLFPRCGQWTEGLADWPIYRIRNLLLERMEIPTGFDGAVFCTVEETPLIESIVYLCISILNDDMGDGTDDLYLFPDHGLLSLHFDHEQLTWALAGNDLPLERFGNTLKERNWAWVQSEENKEQCPMYPFLERETDQES